MTRKFPALEILTTVFPFLLVWASLAGAGTLSITTRADVSTVKDRLQVSVTVANKGDATAHRVQARVLLPDQELEAPAKERIMLNASETFRFEKTISGMKQGSYPLTVIVHFHDANGYPFSALTGTTFYVERPAGAALQCAAYDLLVEEQGELHVDVKDRGFEPKRVRATLVLPVELFTPRSRMDFEINSGDEKKLTFQILNASAQAGAVYPVFCYLEYDLKDTHYTAVAGANAKIAKPQSWFRRTLWYWVGLAILLGIVLAGIQFRRT